MPYHEKHCQESLRKYGKRFDDLHTWMDEPCDINGRAHRAFRHDPATTPQEAKKMFGEFADHACLDHIRLDQQSSEEIASRTMDTNFCEFWEGDEKSKYCRTCTVPSEPCYELWKFVRQLATEQLIFENDRSGKAFGNRYRIESPSEDYCYLKMLQGEMSRFQLPIEDFLYVTRTGHGGINETPSGTRQSPFVDLLLEIIATDPEGEYVIKAVRIDPKDAREVFPSIARPLRIDLSKLEQAKNSLRSSLSPDSENACPKCGSPLVWRTATKTGERYRGCTNYPDCKYNERSY